MLNNMLYSKKNAIYDANKRVKWLYNMVYAKLLLYSMLYSKTVYVIYDPNKRVNT